MAEQEAKKESIFKRLQNARLLRGKMDFSILLMISVLCAFGLVMVFSASSVSAYYDTGGNAAYYFIRQGIFAAVEVRESPAVTPTRT